jgi:hypothetical protein
MSCLAAVTYEFRISFHDTREQTHEYFFHDAAIPRGNYRRLLRNRFQCHDDSIIRLILQP